MTDTTPRYGFPISSVFFQICVTIFITLLLFLTIISNFIVGSFLIIVSLFCFWYFLILNFKKKFFSLREKILHQMISQAHLTGIERVLDLGTGAGYIAIQFSKLLDSGTVIGVDKYDQHTPVLGSNFFEELKINFFGNTLEQARQNARIENQQDKIIFVKSDLKRHFPFSNESYNVILSSQFLYCIPQKKIEKVLTEIDRDLKPSGKLIFFESKKFWNWDIAKIQLVFNRLGYHTHIHPLNNMPNKCIFIAKKP